MEGFCLNLVPGLRGIRDGFVDADTLIRGDAPRDRGLDVGGVDLNHVVVFRVWIGCERLPVLDCGVPLVSGWGVGTALEKLEGLLIGIDVTAAGASLDSHVAHSHALFHGHFVEELAGILVGVSNTTLGAKETNNVEGDVLGVDARPELPGYLDTAHFERFHSHRLGGENVADLSGPDTESDGPEGSMGGGVGIAAGDSGSGLGDALLGADHVDDALFA